MEWLVQILLLEQRRGKENQGGQSARVPHAQAVAVTLSIPLRWGWGKREGKMSKTSLIKLLPVFIFTPNTTLSQHANCALPVQEVQVQALVRGTRSHMTQRRSSVAK